MFKYAPDTVENTHKIAERCNVEIEFGVTKLPAFDVPEEYGKNSWVYLNALCYEGLKKRYPEVPMPHLLLSHTFPLKDISAPLLPDTHS